MKRTLIGEVLKTVGALLALLALVVLFAFATVRTALGADLAVIAPDASPAGTPVLIRLEQADSIEFAKLLVDPEPAGSMLLRVHTSVGEEAYLFWASQPGRYLFICVGYDPAGRVLHVLKHPLQYGVGPGPEPDPDPDPDPDPFPEPPPDVTTLWSVLVYESDEVDDIPGLANILASQTIRRLASPTCKLLFADKDEVDESGQPPEVTRTWTARAATDGRVLPWLYLVNQDGELVHEQAVPEAVVDVVLLIKKYAPPPDDKPEPGLIAPRPDAACPTGNCPTTTRRRGR